MCCGTSSGCVVLASLPRTRSRVVGNEAYPARLARDRRGGLAGDRQRRGPATRPAGGDSTGYTRDQGGATPATGRGDARLAGADGGAVPLQRRCAVLPDDDP